MSQYKNTQRQDESRNTSSDKKAFVEPKLTFVQPELVKRGELADLTEGFLGGFDVS